MDLGSIAKLIIFVGVVMMAMGIILLFADKIPWLGKLPGDIYIQRKNLSLYLPVTTCIVISVFLSIILYFIFRR